MLAIYEATSTCNLIGGRPNQKILPVNLGKDLRTFVKCVAMRNLTRTTNIEGCPGLLSSTLACSVRFDFFFALVPIIYLD